MSERGKAYNIARYQQVRDYSGLRFEKITPTDIDGLMDFRDSAWVIIELKQSGNEMPYGQRLALERLTDNLSTIKPSICFIADHDTSADQEIEAAAAVVVMFRYNKRWVDDIRKITLRQAIDSFLQKQGIKIE